MTSRNDSGSRRSASAVESATSEKTTETVLRTSRCMTFSLAFLGASDVRLQGSARGGPSPLALGCRYWACPQPLQNRAPEASLVPQYGQNPRAWASRSSTSTASLRRLGWELAGASAAFTAGACSASRSSTDGWSTSAQGSTSARPAPSAGVDG